MKICKGDTVKVIAGNDKGKTGTVIHVIPEKDRVIVEKLNMIKRHQKPTQTNQLGGIVEKEAGIHVSNVMVLTPSGRPTRVQFRTDDNGKKVRFSPKHDEYID